MAPDWVDAWRRTAVASAALLRLEHTTPADRERWTRRYHFAMRRWFVAARLERLEQEAA